MGQWLAGYCLDPQADDDQDSLTNIFEAGLGMSPLSADSDGDGVREDDEVSCDGVDNDCDGETDERFSAGGSVTFDGGPYAADA